jgi:hypothetical protein
MAGMATEHAKREMRVESGFFEDAFPKARGSNEEGTLLGRWGRRSVGAWIRLGGPGSGADGIVALGSSRRVAGDAGIWTTTSPRRLKPGRSGQKCESRFAWLGGPVDRALCFAVALLAAISWVGLVLLVVNLHRAAQAFLRRLAADVKAELDEGDRVQRP